MNHSCRQVQTALGAVGGLRLLRSYVVFHLMRWFPTWAGWLPRHEPVITKAKAGSSRQSPRAMQPAALPELHSSMSSGTAGAAFRNARGGPG